MLTKKELLAGGGLGGDARREAGVSPWDGADRFDAATDMLLLAAANTCQPPASGAASVSLQANVTKRSEAGSGSEWGSLSLFPLRDVAPSGFSSISTITPLVSSLHKSSVHYNSLSSTGTAALLPLPFFMTVDVDVTVDNNRKRWCEEEDRRGVDNKRRLRDDETEAGDKADKAFGHGQMKRVRVEVEQEEDVLIVDGDGDDFELFPLTLPHATSEVNVNVQVEENTVVEGGVERVERDSSLSLFLHDISFSFLFQDEVVDANLSVDVSSMSKRVESEHLSSSLSFSMSKSTSTFKSLLRGISEAA